MDAISEAAAERLCLALPAGERERAARFRQPADRVRFIVARAALRRILSNTLGEPFGAIALVTSPTGNPQLTSRSPQFNLAHSGSVVLIAIADEAAVGVDVERVRDLAARDEIASRFMHAGERAEIARLTGAQAELAFFRCWTRKEAVAKALGLGLSLPLHRYRVTCASAQDARVLSIDEDEAGAGSWFLAGLSPHTGHVGAVAWRDAPLTLRRRTLELAR